MEILKAVVLLGALGLIFGLILDFASKKFAVEVDPREEEILGALPGANCGGCGYPGCGGCAAAIVKGEAPINACPVGGAAVAEKIGSIMGVEAESGGRKVAHVICKGTCDKAKEKFEYDGVQECRAASVLNGGQKSCAQGCLGFGTCVSVCAFDAIHIIDGVAVVDEEKCVNCGKCREVCPKGLIVEKPASQEIIVNCNNNQKGKVVKDNCSAGCIGCGLCERNCKFDAVHVENNIAKIDPEKCVGCMVCVEKCPTKVIAGDLAKRQKVTIDKDLCVGCTICAKQCKFDAISGEIKVAHEIDQDKCVGCHLCMQKCPKKAIKLV